jgi:hypothetical protein
VKRTSASNERRRSEASSSGGEQKRKDAEDFRDEPARAWKSRIKTAQPMQNGRLKSLLKRRPLQREV